MIDQIISLCKLIFAPILLFFTRKSGKDQVKGKVAEDEIEHIDEAKNARDGLSNDSDRRERLRELFNDEKER